MELERIEQQKTKVILQFAIPSIVAMVLTSMINIVDGFFIGNYVGTEGLAAVNLGLPIVYLYLAIGLMIAVGGIAIAGRQLGAEQVDAANQVFRQTIVICIIVNIILTILLCVFLKPISCLFQADALTRTHFVKYYGILLFELPMTILTSACGMFIRGEGNPVFVMVTNILTVLLNILLDYVFVAPMKLGVAGVAWASLLASGIVLLITLGYFIRKSKLFRFGRFHFEKEVIQEIFFNGSSEFIGELSMCISMAAYNFVILMYAGVDGVAAFTIIGYVSYVFSMVIIGFGQGIVPIISFSYGAERFQLAIAVRNTTIKMVVGSAIVVFIVMSFLTRWYCGLFSQSSNVSAMVTPGLRIQMSSFAFAGINTLASFYFTSIGKAKESAVISSLRGFVILLTAIFTLPLLLGITGVWFVSLITEGVTILFSLAYMRKDAILYLSTK